jgi:DUF971 family protein
MQPVDVQQVGEELAIKWADGSESFIRLERLRRGCPCAGCQGEMDVLGRVHRGPVKPLTVPAYDLRQLNRVGGYALQPVWGDGHNSGLYTFDYLRRLAAETVPGDVGQP